jgi:hypothetical protein
MDVQEFKRVLASFADEPSDVDVRLGKVVAQVREELIDITLSYSAGLERQLLVTENDAVLPARLWLTNRVARLPQLADRILAATAVSAPVAAQSPFVVPSGLLSADLSSDIDSESDICVNDAVDALLEKATNPLPGATSVLYLTSDAGEGKTTVINRAARLQAERFKSKKVSTLVVPIPLSGRAFLTFDDAVIAALVNKLRFNYFYFDAFIELVKMGALVPAFDGYEEMLVEGSKGEAISALGNLVQTMESSGTLFIAARKAFFEYLSFKTQARLLDAIGDRSASFSRLALSRWNRQQFCEYGHLRNASEPEQMYQAVSARLTTNHPLLTRAVLVRRMFDVAAAGNNQADLIALLGNRPQDYFYTFVDAIVKREASEKWLSRVSGDVMEPLLTPEEHHQLLSLIAQEMWQSASTSLRYDVLDTIVELFAEGASKRGIAIRQIKERLRQHSLLAIDANRGQALAFDHEDFQNFYLGESLGGLLAKGTRSDIQAFLSVNLVPSTTIEQAVQYVVRHLAPLESLIRTLSEINETESGFTFCKENCGSLAVRLTECLLPEHPTVLLNKMFLSAGILAGRKLSRIQFSACQFQPTSLESSSLILASFINCEFERLEIPSDITLSGCVFSSCRIDSLLLTPEDDQIFDPAAVLRTLKSRGARVSEVELPTESVSRIVDGRIKLFERFLRAFLRRTHIDDELIRLRLGKGFAPAFYDDVLPGLLSNRIVEEVPWRGRGIQQRYKLTVQMAEIDSALGRCDGDFNALLADLRR